MYASSSLMQWMLLSLLWLARSCTTLQSESLQTLGLLGSHFGYPQNQSHDYVVVGGGTAGLAIAYRLAENTALTVAVIEAGSLYELDNGNQTSIPALGFGGVGNDPAQSIINPKIDWEQYTTPQTVRSVSSIIENSMASKHSQALNGQQILYPQARHSEEGVHVTTKRISVVPPRGTNDGRLRLGIQAIPSMHFYPISTAQSLLNRQARQFSHLTLPFLPTNQTSPCTMVHSRFLIRSGRTPSVAGQEEPSMKLVSQKLTISLAAACLAAKSPPARKILVLKHEVLPKQVFCGEPLNCLHR